MKASKQQRKIQQIELVETYNLAKSLERIKNAPGWDSSRWRRALYHAVSMADCGSFDEMASLRQTLKLP